MCADFCVCECIPSQTKTIRIAIVNGLCMQQCFFLLSSLVCEHQMHPLHIHCFPSTFSSSTHSSPNRFNFYLRMFRYLIHFCLACIPFAHTQTGLVGILRFSDWNRSLRSCACILIRSGRNQNVSVVPITIKNKNLRMAFIFSASSWQQRRAVSPIAIITIIVRMRHACIRKRKNEKN